MTSLLPYRDAFFAPIRDEFDKLFDSFFGSDSLHTIRSKSHSGYPKLDVIETDKEYVIEVEVPGVNPDTLKVEIVPWEFSTNKVKTSDRKALRLSGRKDYDYQYPEGTLWHTREMRRSQFTREVLLPEQVEGDPAAIYEKGILKLSWAKPEPVPKPEPKQIPITKK